eukprot:3324387-Pyramimonas_sp.AAC.1
MDPVSALISLASLGKNLYNAALEFQAIVELMRELSENSLQQVIESIEAAQAMLEAVEATEMISEISDAAGAVVDTTMDA